MQHTLVCRARVDSMIAVLNKLFCYVRVIPNKNKKCLQLSRAGRSQRSHAGEAIVTEEMMERMTWLRNMQFVHSTNPDGRKCTTCSHRDDDADPVWQKVLSKHQAALQAAGVFVVRINCFINTLDGRC